MAEREHKTIQSFGTKYLRHKYTNNNDDDDNNNNNKKTDRRRKIRKKKPLKSNVIFDFQMMGNIFKHLNINNFIHQNNKEEKVKKSIYKVTRNNS